LSTGQCPLKTAEAGNELDDFDVIEINEALPGCSPLQK
jgi:hypothetical protein